MVAAVAAYYFLVKPPAEKFVCDTCGAEFDTPEELEDHMFDEHGVVPEELPREQTFYTDWGPWEYDTLNPLTGEQYGWGQIYQPLAMADFIGGCLQPIVAESWEWIDDYTFEVKLRPEARFWDGTPITAEVVKGDMEMLADERCWVLTDLFEIIESVEIIDDHTLRITMSEDYPHYVVGMQDLLMATTVFPVERWSQILEECEDIWEFQNLDLEAINASGPYRPVSWTAGEEDTLVRVKDWWGEEIGWYAGPKYWKNINLFEMREQEWQIILDGGLDWADGGFLMNLEEKLKSDPDRFGTWDMDATGIDMFPTLAGAWDLVPSYETLPIVCNNQWLRYALAYATPYEEIKEKTAHVGIAGGSPSFINSTKWMQQYIDEDLIRDTFETVERFGTPVIKYDPELAVEILEEHCEGSVEEGWWYPDKETGEKIGEWKLAAPNGWSQAMATARIIAKAWTGIGIPTEEDFPDESVIETFMETREFEWTTAGACAWTSMSPVFNLQHALMGEPHWWWNSPVWYEKWWPEEAAQISEMLDELATYEIGDPEGIALCKEIQAIYVPQLVFIPWSDMPSSPVYTKDYWVNWISADDPQPLVGDLEYHLLYAMPRFVETTGVELSSETVEAGEPVTVTVTLRNTGERAHRYPVYVRDGPAEPGPGPEVLAHTAVVVPAGKTITVELTVTMDEPGTYTLTVDDWRIDKWDPGDPIEKTLTVT